MATATLPSAPAARLAGSSSRAIPGLGPRLLPLGGYVAFAVVFFGTAWVSPTTRWIGVGGDAADAIWNLANTAHLLFHWQNPFQTALMNYPTGVNLTWQTPTFLFGLLLAPITLLGGPVLAYNVLCTLAFAATGYLTSLAVRRWVRQRWIAHAAGVAFMISPFMLVNGLSHPFMSAAMVVPLTAIWFDWALVCRSATSRRAGLTLALIVIGEFYMSAEFALIAVIMLALACSVLAILHPSGLRSRVRPMLGILVWSVPLIAACSSPYILWQFLGPGRFSGPAMPPDLFYGDLLGFLVPGPTSATAPLFGSLFSRVANWPLEDGTYLGIAVIALSTISAVRTWRDPRSRFAVALALCTASLVLGPTVHAAGQAIVPSPALLLWKAPLVADMLPVRISVYLDFLVVVVCALALDHEGGRRPRLGLKCLALVAVLTWLPYLPYPSTDYPVPQYFSSGEMGSGQVLMVVPFAQDVRTTGPMEWQAASAMSYAMVDGYFTRTNGYDPLSHGPPYNPLTWTLWYLEFVEPPLENGGKAWSQSPLMATEAGYPSHPTLAELRTPPPALRSYAAHYLRCTGTTKVVLGPTQHEDSIRAFLEQLIQAPPTRVGGVYVWTRPAGGWGPAAPSTCPA